MIDSGWPRVLPRPANKNLPRIESISPWFAIYKIEEDTYALIEPNHWEEVVSYLILGRERALLFDTGMGIADIRAEVEALTNLPVLAVNSHFHYDHVGGNSLFEDVRACDNDFEIGRIQKGYSAEECREFMAPGSYLFLPPGFDPSTYHIPGTGKIRRLAHLESMELGGRILTVHHTPGETPGGICLHDNRHGFLFTGDLFYPGTLWVHLEESDFEQYRWSLRYLCGLLDRVSLLCPAHNEALADKEMLPRALKAFDEIAKGRAPDFMEEGDLVFLFEGFRVALDRRG